ncbi:hypothetical protein COB55_00355 [Candidatus Wolfebacteria bacterium]|nr:MAG: hypothetical protein COB55_00355 [Candidatus Wolfebacteria bacterium]
MRDFARKRKKRSVMCSRITLVALVVIVILFAHGVWGVYQKSHSAKERRMHVETELEELIEKKKVLTDGINRLDTDRGIEEEIREKYRLTKEGEELIVILEDEDLSSEQTAVALPASKGVFGKFLDSIF